MRNLLLPLKWGAMWALLRGVAAFAILGLAVHAGYVRLLSLDWSPTGDLMLFVQMNDVYARAPGSEELRKLTDEGSVIWARFAPDGNHFYYIALQDGYYVVKRGELNGEARETVLGEEGVNFFYVAPFPDGERLVVVSDREGQTDLWIYHLKEKVFTRLTNNPGLEATPDVSRDGKTIAFVALWKDSQSWDIHLIRLVGEEVNYDVLTEDPFFDWAPRISPDGKWIAFESNRSGDSEIWVMRTQGSASSLTRITNDRWRNAFPAWSPDMEELAFGTRRDGEDAWTITVTGTY